MKQLLESSHILCACDVNDNPSAYRWRLARSRLKTWMNVILNSPSRIGNKQGGLFEFCVYGMNRLCHYSRPPERCASPSFDTAPARLLRMRVRKRLIGTRASSDLRSPMPRGGSISTDPGFFNKTPYATPTHPLEWRLVGQSRGGVVATKAASRFPYRQNENTGRRIPHVYRHHPLIPAPGSFPVL